MAEGDGSAGCAGCLGFVVGFCVCGLLGLGIGLLLWSVAKAIGLALIMAVGGGLILHWLVWSIVRRMEFNEKVKRIGSRCDAP